MILAIKGSIELLSEGSDVQIVSGTPQKTPKAL